MASDIVTHGITYRGTDCVTIVSGQVRVCLRVVKGLYDGLEVRGQDTVIPSAAGMTARNRVKHRRTIEVEGFVQGTGATETLRRADFEAALQELDALFDPSLAAGTLVVDLQDGTTATISARTLPETMPGPDTIPTRRAMSYRLEATSPDWVFGGGGS